MDIIETLILIGIFSVIGFVNEKTKPQEYYYENGIVTVYKKYQCPINCEADHFHLHRARCGCRGHHRRRRLNCAGAVSGQEGEAEQLFSVNQIPVAFDRHFLFLPSSLLSLSRPHWWLHWGWLFV